MQAKVKCVLLVGALFAGVTTMVHAQTASDARKAVEPPAAGVSDYIPPENLDPNLMAIQIKRLDDRVLALEQTNERLVERVKVLTESYNALIEFLKSGSSNQGQ